MPGEAAIETRDLTKVFQRRQSGWRLPWRRGGGDAITAVDGVDLAVARGELFGLLGPNGAGKTTLVKLLSTLLLPTEGWARVAGHDVAEAPREVRRRVGVVLGGERALYWRLTARENLWYFSQLYNIPGAEARERIGELLELVGLGDRAEERVENYSKGMKQRLHVARGLLNDPEVLLLDEPSIGLDPHAAREVRRLVRRLVDEEGKTVVLTTHYMYEADELSDRVAIIDQGRIVALDTPEALKARLADRAVLRLEVAGAEDALEKRLAAAPGVARVAPHGYDAARDATAYRLQGVDGAEGLASEVARLVAREGCELRALEVERPSLEDVFVELTGRTMAVGARSAEPAADAAADADGAGAGGDGAAGDDAARGGGGGGAGL